MDMAHSGFESSKLAVHNCSLNTQGIVNLTGYTHNGMDVSSNAPSLMRIGWSNLLTPLANGFIRHPDLTFS
jgi:hypothetical protein